MQHDNSFSWFGLIILLYENRILVEKEFFHCILTTKMTSTVVMAIEVEEPGLLLIKVDQHKTAIIFSRISIWIAKIKLL